MKNLYLSSLIAAAALGLTACGDSISSNSIFSDDVVTNDVAASAGDDIASAVSDMAGADALGTAPVNATSSSGIPGYSRICYDANGVVVNGCSPFSSVRKIVAHIVLDADRSGTTTINGVTVSWSGAIHRIGDDTVTRNFNTADPPVEQSRTHVAQGSAHDTTTFSSDTLSRKHIEAAHDSVKSLTWNMPRSQNPWPVSGMVVRLDTVHATFTKGSTSETRDVTRRVEVDFPADAQGNVVLKVNGKTCNLNLVNHRVTACS